VKTLNIQGVSKLARINCNTISRLQTVKTLNTQGVSKLVVRLRHSSVDVDVFITSTACCNPDL